MNTSNRNITQTQKPTGIVPNSLPATCRPEVLAVLNNTFGYEGFRTLEIYEDLNNGKNTVPVSQGQIAEKVIEEAERAARGENATNILLTAPTGAGKSLLFQLPAVFLGQEYGMLTIVVSPLKALIEDQVDSLNTIGYTKAVFASSDLSPEQKADVYQRVKDGRADILYLSPELLLSYDIRHFAGDRHVGLVVIDEAHTVTTWGKEFRVDYWFLGRYLTGLRQELGYGFPVFALTATAVWNPAGWNDMVFSTVRSLCMEPAEVYVGTVRRKNIGFDIRQLEVKEGETYENRKQQAIFGRVDGYLKGHKTLLYYPFAGGMDQRVRSWVAVQNWHLVDTYYGKKDKEQKAAIVEAFRQGEKKMIVATKAFGMGVDIPDIDRVYHVAPPSTFVDYIQEIGRSGRDASIASVAATDYHERDFYYMTRLHQLGDISQAQLAVILHKLTEIYDMQGSRDQMPVSLSDFEFAVKIPRARSKTDYEAELGQITKTALLWIEEDLEQRFGRKIIEVMPLNLMSEGLLQDKTGEAFAQRFARYLTPVEGVPGTYRARLDSMWEECFPDMGYVEFKQHLSNGTLAEGMRPVLVGKHEVLLKTDSLELKQRLDALFMSLKRMMSLKLFTAKGRFDESELLAIFEEHKLDVRSAKHFLRSLLESRTEEGRSVSYISSVKKRTSNELSFTVTRGFDLLLSRYQKLFQQKITGSAGDRLTFYCTPFSDLNTLLNLLSMLGGLSFTVEGSGSPAVMVTFHEPDTLRQVDSEGYSNRILDVNEQIFDEQIELFQMFFGTSTLSDDERWGFIEDYFTGSSVAELKDKYELNDNEERTE